MPAVDRPTLALGNYSLARHRRDNVTQTRLREDRDAVWASTVDTTIRSVPLGSSAQKAERREAAYDIELLGGPPDLVLSDMAHNTVGHRQTDHLKIIALIEIAADFAIRTLKPGGHFVSKNFQGGDAGGVLARLRAEFETVKYVKPESSRKDSAEVFLVAMNRR